MKKLLKSSFLNLHSCPKEDLSQYIRTGLAFLKDAGFDAANICFRSYLPAIDQWQQMTEQALRDSEDLGIPFTDCHLPFFNDRINTDPVFAENANKQIHAAIDAAKTLGVQTAVLHPNASTVTLHSFDRKETYDMVMAHLSPFAEHAAKVGLNLLVENSRLVPGIRQSHRYCQGPEELCEVADALGFGVCWDFGHANLAGLKQSEALAYVGKRLKAVHVNDNNGTDDDHTAPFMGTVDWVDAMHGLALAEFDGRFNYELVTSRVPAAFRMEYAKYLVAAADQLMEYIV